MRRNGVVASSVRVPTYSILASTTSVNEGSSVVFTINTTNVNDGTILYWTTQTISGNINTSDFTDSQVSGSFVVSNNTASLTRGITEDLTTEGPESFKIYVRTESTSGTVVAISGTVIINDTSVPAPTYTISPNVTSVNEGSSVTFTVSTTNIPDNTTLFWTTQQVSGTINTSDFTDSSLSGSVVVNNNTASVVRGIRADSTTENTESFRLQLRTVSTSGTIVATSSTVTINDTSTTPVVPSPVTTTQTWGPFDAQNYWTARSTVPSNKEGSSDHIQGTFDGTSFNRRGTLIFFPSSIRSTLSGATINKVEVFVARANTQHGNWGSGFQSPVRLHSHAETTAINIWTGTGLTSIGSISLAIGSGGWVDVGATVGNGIRNGTINGIAVYTTNNSINEYVRLLRSETRIRITFTK
jgi:hypothetical protein